MEGVTHEEEMLKWKRKAEAREEARQAKIRARMFEGQCEEDWCEHDWSYGFLQGRRCSKCDRVEV